VELKSGLPAVSIIIPTHSRPHLLPQVVESARQAGTNVEIIVIDDASTDETAKVCRDLTGINYIRVERNQGVAGARNLGILVSTAEYIAFLDDDDLRLPGSLDLQIEALEANAEAGFVCGAMIMADQDYQPTGEIIYPRPSGDDAFWELLELDFPVMPLATVIRKECFFRAGLLNRHLSGIDDWDIFTRIAELYPVLVMQTPVGIYRQPTPFSDQGSSDRAAQLHRAACHQLKLLKLPRVMAEPSGRRRELRQRLINRVSVTLLSTATRQISKREFGPAYANISRAFKLDPLSAMRPSNYQKLARKVWRVT
jgi:glycosyltransferase involved in cell wall biosynthesis